MYRSDKPAVVVGNRGPSHSPDAPRRYSVTANEAVFDDRQRLRGYVVRTFYHNSPLGVDPHTLWHEMLEWAREFEKEVTSEKASKFLELTQDELFTEREADMVVRWVKRVFPALGSVTQRCLGQDDLTEEPPLRLAIGPGQAHWDLSHCGAELGFPVGSFADYGLVSEGDKLLPWHGWGARMFLCTLIEFSRWEDGHRPFAGHRETPLRKEG